MTAVLLVLLALAAIGGALVYKSWRDARDAEPPPGYPVCVALDLADRPLRQAWDSLDVDEQAQLLREPADKLREDLSLIAWLTELGVETVRAELAVTDYGMAYG